MKYISFSFLHVNIYGLVFWIQDFLNITTYNEKLGLGPSPLELGRKFFINPRFTKCNGCRPFACLFLDQLGNGTGSLVGNG